MDLFWNLGLFGVRVLVVRFSVWSLLFWVYVFVIVVAWDLVPFVLN